MPGTTETTAAAPPASIGVVLVAWECGPEIVRCVRSLADTTPASVARAVELVVVDNASTDLDGDLLRAAWPRVTLVRNDRNRGFGPAANQGVERATTDLVLLLNPDTIATEGAIAEVLRAFAATPGAVAVAPRLIDAPAPGTEPQERFQLRRFPTLGQAVRELLLLDKLFPASGALRRERYLDVDRSRPFIVEQPAAAALAVRKEVFLAVGGFDESFFPAWFEDVDLCRRLACLGTIYFWPAAVFLHAGGVAAARLGYDVFLPIYYRNGCRYWRKHHGAAAAALYRMLVVVGMLLRLAVLPFRTGLPRPRGEAARAYARTALAALGGPLRVRPENAP